MPNKKDLAVFYLLSFTWGLIWTLVGLFAFSFVYIFMKDKVLIRNIAGRIAVTFKEANFGGISLGIVYFVSKSDNKHTHLHELGHTLQHIWFGPLFLFLVAIPSGIRYQYRGLVWRLSKEWGRRLKPYDSVWFEGQATKLGYAHFSESIYNIFKGE